MKDEIEINSLHEAIRGRRDSFYRGKIKQKFYRMQQRIMRKNLSKNYCIPINCNILNEIGKEQQIELVVE